ncbi:hypothetical protein B0H17DRAFT_1129350 [Mycena rosella]|uniref:Uncharacterized protein n=1 Tax=Mycena rosella TaxID=1033263 RepID=A0AAD7DVK4_MYCRO|nr:hypothetical protein B0H17DRAFT_1129350 [Mycena rosella]
MPSSRSTYSTHLPTEGRAGPKTPGLENAIGKATLKSTVPLHSATQPRTNTDGSTISIKSLVREVARPLVDRTPFPNRAALAKLLLEANRTNALFHDSTGAPIPDNVRRVSSGRTHVRAPRWSANSKFVTPLNSGRHLDVSDVEIATLEVSQSHVRVLESELKITTRWNTCPKSIETYSPPDFSLPNSSYVGKTVLNLAQSHMHDDTPPVEIEPTAEPATWDMFTLPEIKTDDPFQQGIMNAVAVPMPKSAPKRSHATPSSRSRLGTSDARPGTSNSRPGTSTPGARVSKSHLRLPNPASATNTTTTSDSKMALAQARSQGLHVQRPATTATMYPSKLVSAPLSKMTAPVPAQERTRSGLTTGEFAMLKILSLEIEDDFIFDV